MAIQSSLTCLITNLSIEPYHTRWSWPRLTATGYPLAGWEREEFPVGSWSNKWGGGHGCARFSGTRFSGARFSGATGQPQ